MKKTFESWKIWTILSALLFFMTCGVFIVHAAGSSNNWLFTQKYNTGALNNTLTATWWNDLMGDLDNLIPEGAIMAFNLDKCPEWRSEYPLANEWRFLMWATSDIGGVGWATNNEIKLQINQLPAHNHLIKFSKIAKFWDEDDARYGPIDYYTNVWPQWGSNNAHWGNITPSEIKYMSTSLVWSWQPINIAPSYIKVHYCVKWEIKQNTYTIQFGVNGNEGGFISDGSITAPLNTNIQIEWSTVKVWNKIITATANAGYHFESWNNNCGSRLTNNCSIHANFQRNATCTFEIYEDCLWTPQNIQNCEIACESQAGMHEACAGDVVRCLYDWSTSMCDCNLR